MANNKYYKYYQPNKKDIKDKYGDCTIRALTKVLDKTWLEVYDLVSPYERDIAMQFKWFYFRNV